MTGNGSGRTLMKIFPFDTFTVPSRHEAGN